MSEKEFNFRIPKKFNLAIDCIDKWIDNEEISKKIAIYEVSQSLKINSISYRTPVSYTHLTLPTTPYV